MNENVLVSIGIAGNEIRREARERYEPAVPGDRWVVTEHVSLRAVTGKTHALRRPGLAVADEDVCAGIRITWDEVRSSALEGYEPPIGRNGRIVAPRTSLRSARRDTHQFD